MPMVIFLVAFVFFFWFGTALCLHNLVFYGAGKAYFQRDYQRFQYLQRAAWGGAGVIVLGTLVFADPSTPSLLYSLVPPITLIGCWVACYRVLSFFYGGWDHPNQRRLGSSAGQQRVILSIVATLVMLLLAGLSFFLI